MPRWAPLAPSPPLSLQPSFPLFSRCSQRSCVACRFIRPLLLPTTLLSGAGGEDRAARTRSLRSQLLCLAADKTSMHISLKEREDLRDFCSLSFSSFLEIPLFVHLPSPPFFFFFAHLIHFHRLCSASFIFHDASFPLSFKHFLQSFGVSCFFFLVSPTSQSGIDGVAQTLKVTEGEEVSKLREPPNSRLRERRAINCSSCFDFPHWK